MLGRGSIRDFLQKIFFFFKKKFFQKKLPILKKSKIFNFDRKYSKLVFFVVLNNFQKKNFKKNEEKILCLKIF